MDSSLQAKLASYKPAEATIDLIKSSKVLFLVGPTGAGKDSLKLKLLETGKYHHLVSHTTRPPRINHGILEVDGEDYHFINKDTAKKMIDDKAFVEAKVYSGNLYGTSVEEIQEADDEGKIAMTDIEVQGVAEYKSMDPNVMAVFLLPPSFQIWQERLVRRYGDVVDMEDHLVRLETGLNELDQLLNTDYYIAVINDDLEDAAKHVDNIATSESHVNPDEVEARNVAKQLAKDIQEYLDKNAA
jgi:guanylate kinase